MLCDNCGKNEANIKYTQIINGVKKEMNLCEKCGAELGITDMQFDMPINFSNFLGDFFTEFQENGFFPELRQKNELKCNICGSSFDDIISTGKFGCSNCYDVFSDSIDEIIKKIQGSNRHTGRLGKVVKRDNTRNSNYNESEEDKKGKVSKKDDNKTELEKLQYELKQAIKEERYEDAAKIRDKIKEL
jgi:protein arginine kinase activator